MTSPLGFIGGRWGLALNVLLAVQAVGFYGFSRRENTIQSFPLSELSDRFDGWHLKRDVELDPEAKRVLRPDDYLLRTYERSSDRLRANVFVAYFRSQRTGHAPHSPQNCLPGQGWAPELKETFSVPVGGSRDLIEINRIRLAKGHERVVVFYWYQTATGVVANEYRARIHLVGDSIRYNRSDTALVRIEMPLSGEDSAEFDRGAAELIGHVHAAIQQYIPGLNSQ